MSQDNRGNFNGDKHHEQPSPPDKDNDDDKDKKAQKTCKLPVCIFDWNCKIFRVSNHHQKGKAFFSGGFGCMEPAAGALEVNGWNTQPQKEDLKKTVCENGGDVQGDDGNDENVEGDKDDDDDEKDDNDAKPLKPDKEDEKCSDFDHFQVKNSNDDNDGDDNKNDKDDETRDASSTTTNTPSMCLFLEEVLFLQERGLIQALAPEKGDSGGKLYELTFQHLLNLLPVVGLPLAIYLTYAHLRAQTFIVVRHTPQRLSLVRSIRDASDEAASSQWQNGTWATTKKNEEEQERDGSANNNTLVGKDDHAENDKANGGDITTSTTTAKNIPVVGQAEETKKDGMEEDSTSASLPSSSSPTSDPKEKESSSMEKCVPPPVKRKRDEENKEDETTSMQSAPEPPQPRLWKRQRRWKRVSEWMHQLRFDSYHAPVPALFAEPQPATTATTSSSTTTAVPSLIAFHAHQPNSSFRKMNPGLPDFLVAVTCFSSLTTTFSSLQQLVHQSQGVPLRIAAVADGGTVVMFRLEGTSAGAGGVVPTISRKPAKDSDS